MIVESMVCSLVFGLQTIF